MKMERLKQADLKRREAQAARNELEKRAALAASTAAATATATMPPPTKSIPALHPKKTAIPSLPVRKNLHTPKTPATTSSISPNNGNNSKPTSTGSAGSKSSTGSTSSAKSLEDQVNEKKAAMAKARAERDEKQKARLAEEMRSKMKLQQQQVSERSGVERSGAGGGVRKTRDLTKLTHSFARRSSSRIKHRQATLTSHQHQIPPPIPPKMVDPTTTRSKSKTRSSHRCESGQRKPRRRRIWPAKDPQPRATITIPAIATQNPVTHNSNNHNKYNNKKQRTRMRSLIAKTARTTTTRTRSR